MKLILEKAKLQLELKLPFVLYKKPNKTIITGIFQNNDNLFLVNNYTEKGFVFATFDGKQTVIIPKNQSEVFNEESNESYSKILNDEVLYSDESHRDSFENLVTKGIQAIKNEEFKKVVLSRKETVELNYFDLLLAFQNLVQFYPSAFSYCFYHPKVGIWLGASPEQLLKSNGANFNTIALAGTKKANDFKEVSWKKKEIEEQQIVTDYIVNKLKETATDVIVSKPYNYRAGALWHIKTEITAVVNPGFGLQKIIRLLHPTPAVCGLPKDASKGFILENEQYDRTFYTGFLGELNCDDIKETENSDLFVNLRCMEIELSNAQNDSKQILVKAILYIGCGITKDSIPKKEWEESVNKSVTMKKILDMSFY
jgi:isochorismate synthase